MAYGFTKRPLRRLSTVVKIITYLYPNNTMKIFFFGPTSIYSNSPFFFKTLPLDLAPNATAHICALFFFFSTLKRTVA